MILQEIATCAFTHTRKRVLTTFGCEFILDSQNLSHEKGITVAAVFLHSYHQPRPALPV